MNPYMRSYSNRLYKEWAGMHHRCERPGASHFECYGGRGIKVCPEWCGCSGFNNFAKWALDNGYLNTLEIDRITTDGDYSPRNCRWVTHKENSRNRSTYRGAVRAADAIDSNQRIIGVNYRPSRTGNGGSWRALIMVDGKNVSIGTFSEKSDAIRARIEAERLYWGGDAI